MNRFQTVLTLLILFVFSVSSFAEIEPNNTYQTANTLSPNGSDSGSLNEGIPQSSYDPDDYFKVTLTSDGALYVTTTSSSGLDIDLFIYDIDGNNQIASGVRYGTFESVYRLDLKAGTYYVRVYRASGTGSYSLTSRFTSAPYTNDTEPNNTYQTALTLNLNSQATGHINYFQSGTYDGEDWWKLVIPADGSLTISTVSDSADIDLYLYDVNGSNNIRSGVAYGLQEQTSHNYLMPGTYYVRVYAASKRGGYTITTTFTQTSLNGITTNDTEKNDSYSTALNYFSFSSAGSANNYGHLGYYSNSYTDNDDYWSVTTTTDGKLIVRTESNSTLDIDLYLYDINGTSNIRSASAYGANETLTFENLAPGRYYIRVYNSLGGYGSYKITCDFSIPSLANDSGNNDDFSAAALISPESKMTGHLGYYSNNITDNYDYYTFTLASAWDSLNIRSDSESSLDVDLYLYNSSQVNINTGSQYGTKETIKKGSTAAGIYYIRAYRSSGQGGYALKISNRYIVNPLTDVKENRVELPVSYSLSQNYPNPFNPSTKIKYQIPFAGKVLLGVYDLLGREVALLVNKEQNAGFYEVEFDGAGLSSGIYFYRIQADKFTAVKKLLLIK